MFEVFAKLTGTGVEIATPAAVKLVTAIGIRYHGNCHTHRGRMPHTGQRVGSNVCLVEVVVFCFHHVAIAASASGISQAVFAIRLGSVSG